MRPLFRLLLFIVAAAAAPAPAQVFGGGGRVTVVKALPASCKPPAVILLSTAPAGRQLHVCNAGTPAWSVVQSFDAEGRSAATTCPTGAPAGAACATSQFLTPTLIGNLPAAAASKGAILAVSDATSTSDCAIGGAAVFTLCTSNGAAWSVVGGYPGPAPASVPYTVASVSTAAYSVTVAASTLLLVDATSTNVGITLFSAVGNRGAQVIIKRTDATGNTITTAGTGAQTIDGAANILLYRQGDSISLVSDGANWRII